MGTLRRWRDGTRRYVPWTFVLGKWLTLLFSPRSFLRTSGYLASVGSGRPIRRDGSPIPWMNYPVVGFLEQRLRGDLVLFEYGSGNSTLFYAERVSRVVAVEDNPDWFAEISRQAPENARILLCAPFDAERYAGMIRDQDGLFDVVVIDGKERLRCLEVAPDCLTEGGVILLDDVNSDEYLEGIEKTREKGFRVLEFQGLKAGSIRVYTTLLFYRPGNVLGL
ncbi:MAG: hypothetical protein P8102_06155 [Gammaproteobacteria bacterium]